MAGYRISYDRDGTPGIWAEDAAGAYGGLGWVHGRHRPLQTLLLHSAARGQLSAQLLGVDALVALDLVSHRWDLARRGAAAVSQLQSPYREWLLAYVAGLRRGLARGGRPFEFRVLLARLAEPDAASALAALMFSAYLSQAGGQERMEAAVVQCLQAGGDPLVLQRMFAPHLDGCGEAMAGLASEGVAMWQAPDGVGAAGGVGAGPRVSGSNAWAVDGRWTASGMPMVCGDPHLEVHQLPSLLMEIRARVGETYWLGATIPGLPGVAVGRNRSVAWSGTFAVADNLDLTVETVASSGVGDGGVVQRAPGETEPVRVREERLGRRARRPLVVRVCETSRGGWLEHDGLGGGSWLSRKVRLAARWTGTGGVAEAMGAYMALPLCRDAAEASAVLRRAHTLSLHFVVADVGGAMVHQQTGSVPARREGCGGLLPHWGAGHDPWTGEVRRGDWFGVGVRAEDGLLVSANEGRLGADGVSTATLAQPGYRLQRIVSWLRGSRRHNVASMQALQRDVLSLRGLRLRGFFLQHLPNGPVRQALRDWGARCEVTSRGAHAFALAYQGALAGLAGALGGDWFLHMLKETELPVWWGAGLDGLLADPSVWCGDLGTQLRGALVRVGRDGAAELRPWGEVQRFSLQHPLFGMLPGWLGFHRGPYPLPGGSATVAQGSIYKQQGQPLAVSAAYRMVCDLGESGIWTCLPGGVDGSRFSGSYARWLEDWREGRYHQVLPPGEGERFVSI